MRIVDTTCTNCGANIHIDADRKTAFCEYCGAQLLIDDEVQHLQIDNAGRRLRGIIQRNLSLCLKRIKR